MIKVYAALALIALIVGACWRYNYVVKDRDQLKANLELANFVSKQYIDKVEAQAKDLTEYQAKLDEKLNENSTLRDAVNRGDKRVLVRASCASTKATDTSTIETTPQLTATARQDYFRLREGIILLEANYNLCLRQLN